MNLAQTLSKYRLAKAQSASVAGHLLDQATKAIEASEFGRARSHFEQGARWFEVAGDLSQAAHLIAQQAETWVREAEARSQPPTPSFMVAASFYENAIQTYRLIPRAQRETLHVEDRMKALRQLHANASQ